MHLQAVIASFELTTSIDLYCVSTVGAFDQSPAVPAFSSISFIRSLPSLVKVQVILLSSISLCVAELKNVATIGKNKGHK